MQWELNDKDADLLIEAIKVGLEDASVQGREKAREAYINIWLKFPRKAERIKATLSSSLRVNNKCVYIYFKKLNFISSSPLLYYV